MGGDGGEGDGIGDSPVRVLVVDDHRTFAELLLGALERHPGLEGLGRAGTVRDALASVEAMHPDVVVMDIRLPDGDGIEASRLILESRPDTRIVLLNGDPQSVALRRAAAVGVAAYLPKDGPLSSLLAAIRHAEPWAMQVDPSLFDSVAVPPTEFDGPMLTPRETDVLRHLADGKDVARTAQQLGISVNTCRGYVKTILTKLGAHSQLEAVVVAMRLGLITGNQASRDH